MQPAVTRQLTGRRTGVVVGAAGCSMRPAPVEARDVRAVALPAGAGRPNPAQPAMSRTEPGEPARPETGCAPYQLAGPPQTGRPGRQPVLHEPGRPRINPLEPLLPRLVERLRGIRRQQMMEEGSARVRTDAQGRGHERGPALSRAREGTS